MPTKQKLVKTNGNASLPSDAAPALRQLVAFWRHAPHDADHTVLVATGIPDTILVDRTADELRKLDIVQIAAQALSACHDWAESEERQVRFRVTWQKGDTIRGSHQWKMGDGGEEIVLDGSTGSMLAQTQTNVRDLMRVFTGGFEMIQAGAQELLASAQTRIRELEVENRDLRDRLKKGHDFDNELAMAAFAAELESGDKRFAMFEKYIGPHLPAALADMAGKTLKGLSSGTAAAATAGNQVQSQQAGSNQKAALGKTASARK